ncbi:MAG: hypothetical protein J6D16_05775 [Clostridia bacterium]|nr:hypothetical protein [Clostridia bacterium]
MIRVDVVLPLGFDKETLRKNCAERLGRELSPSVSLRLLRLAVNADDTANIHYKAAVLLSLDTKSEKHLIQRRRASAYEEAPFSLPEAKPFAKRPIVVGLGPAGLFAALLLAECGARPIVLERGFDVDTRARAVASFFDGGMLDEQNNVQFGEGGAGSFSDGKLKIGSMTGDKRKILETLIWAGAPERILYDAHAHIGTDLLRGVVKKIRQKIEELGGTVHFGARLEDILFEKNGVRGVCYRHGGKAVELETDSLILATGHSARDVFRMLKRHGLPMEARGFGIGVRVEHPRTHIDRMFYGQTPPEELGAASYRFVTHLSSGRSVYSFCMCPGGSVVAATSLEGAVVTNGMSLHARDAENSNAALLVSVTPDDFGGDPMAGLAFQEKYERLAFSMARDFRAPAVRMEDFLAERPSKALGEVRPSYPRGVILGELDLCLPSFATESLRAAIPEFDAYKKGFYLPDAVLTGVETRTTSPIRILRDESGQALRGLYPAGEGAGYAGGIISSALDGLLSAKKLIKNHQKD